MLQQVTYISTPRTAVTDAVLADILNTSRRNNRRDGVTGLLAFDAFRFLQALEGPDQHVKAALARIRADRRHFAVVVLSDRAVAQREFGSWDMAARSRDDPDDMLVRQLNALAAGAAPSVRGTFEGFARIRRTARPVTGARTPR